MYLYERYLRTVVDDRWIACQVTDYNKTTTAQRIEKHKRIIPWCMTTFGHAYGTQYDPRVCEFSGKWFYAISKYPTVDDILFFKNEEDAAFFMLNFSDDVYYTTLGRND
jgi:hypothetical protein